MENKLNLEIDEAINDIVNKRKNHKKSIILCIGVGIIVIALAILIFGYTKLNWLQKEKNNLDIELNSFQNQIQYFTDNKVIKTITGYNNGKKIENVQNIDTDFMVSITEKKDSKNDAILIILESRGKFEEDKEEIINSFNIFNEETLKEFDSNPDESKYQIAKFTYFDNGTIIDILLPKNMDEDNAQILMGIIEGVTPKLTRNKTEDLYSGINIEVSDLKEGEGKSQIITQSNKVYVDKFTKKEFKGSKYRSIVKINFKDKMIKNIESQTNLLLKNEIENKNSINIGLDSVDIQINSNITLTKFEEENKEIVQLMKNLAEKYEYMEIEELINSLIKKEEVEENNEQSKSSDEEPTKNIRKLGEIENDIVDYLKDQGSFVFEQKILSFTILSQEIKFFYNFIISTDGKIKNVLYVECLNKKIEIGIENLEALKKNETEIESENKDFVPEFTLLKFPFTILSIPLKVEFIIGGELDWGFLLAINKFSFNISPTIYCKAQLNAGPKKFKFSVGIKGDLLEAATETSIIKEDENLKFYSGISFSTARINLYAEAKFWGKKIFSKSVEIFQGIEIKTFEWDNILYKND